LRWDIGLRVLADGAIVPERTSFVPILTVKRDALLNTFKELSIRPQRSLPITEGAIGVHHLADHLFLSNDTLGHRRTLISFVISTVNHRICYRRLGKSLGVLRFYEVT
jgi:hypothetical protein